MSSACSFSNEGIAGYTAAKSGFDALTKVFRKEAREEGVKVCVIYPSGVDTPLKTANDQSILSLIVLSIRSSIWPVNQIMSVLMN